MSASMAPWSRPFAPTTTAAAPSGATPFAGPNPMGTSGLNNLNSSLPAAPNLGSNLPSVPQAPAMSFPINRQPLGGTNTVTTDNYVPPSTISPFNQFPSNILYAPPPPPPNPGQIIQNEMNQRRLAQLEDENVQRRNTTLNLREMGRQLLQDQMEIQEQILGYQFMLEHCLDTLDHQNFILTEQSQELALLRAKIKQFEVFVNTVKQYKENNLYGQNISPEWNYLMGNQLCSQNFWPLQDFMGNSPCFPNDVTRTLSSKFQPFNPRYRSPTKELTGNPNLTLTRPSNPPKN